MMAGINGATTAPGSWHFLHAVLLGHLNRTEPLLILSVTPSFFLQWRIKMSDVKWACHMFWIKQTSTTITQVVRNDL